MQRRKAIVLTIHPFSNNALIYSSCSQLQYFSTFQLFDYERLVNILLFIVSEHKGEENNFVQRAGICLLNSLACQVSSCGPSYKKNLLRAHYLTISNIKFSGRYDEIPNKVLPNDIFRKDWKFLLSRFTRDGAP